MRAQFEQSTVFLVIGMLTMLQITAAAGEPAMANSSIAGAGVLGSDIDEKDGKNGESRIFITCRETLLLSEKSPRRMIRSVPCCTILKEFETGERTQNNRGDVLQVWCDVGGGVRVPSLVQKSHVFSIEEMRRRVLATLSDDSIRIDLKIKPSVPKVVLLSDPIIVEAWGEIADLISLNEEIRKTEPRKQSPEPHLAKAHLWVAVGCNSDALEEFSKAAHLIRIQKTGELVEYAKYFTVLEESLRRATKAPGKPYVASARQYWGEGKNHYRAGRFDDAILNFTDAVRIGPSDPTSWYSRALAYRELGLNEEAERDARIGVTLEHRLNEMDAQVLRIGQSLEGMQGPNRFWLEEFRRGDGRRWGRH